MNTRRASLLILAAFACAALACDDDDPIAPEPPWPPAAPTPPENVLENLMTIYNDDEHTTAERIAAYEALLLHPSAYPRRPGFRFIFQPGDGGGQPESWGLEEEMEAHRNLFSAQERGEIYLIELRITYGETKRVVGAERIHWERIFASNVYLRVMFNPDDGLEVDGEQADFLFAPDTLQPPAAGARFYGRYWIGEWTDLPRPAPRGAAAVGPTTWGGIKAVFLP